MRIKDYGQYLKYYQYGSAGKYRVDFYKHDKITHSMDIAEGDVATLSEAFSRYEVRKGDDFIFNSTANLFFIDAGHSTIGLGVSTPSAPFKVK